MKKLLPILFLFTYLSVLGQDNESQNIPTFKGSSTNLPSILKLQDLKDRTQDFISQQIDSAFVKKNFNPKESFEFNIEFNIDKQGFLDPLTIAVNTNIDFFNDEIKSILIKLPKFTPAREFLRNQPIIYLANFNIEFLINQFHRFVPIYRDNIGIVVYNINPNEKVFMTLADTLGYNFQSTGFVKNMVYFSTDSTKEIVKIKIQADHVGFQNKIFPFVKNLKLTHPKLFKKLLLNKNYALRVDLYLHREAYTYSMYEKHNKITSINNNLNQKDSNAKYEVVVIYPGCEKEKNNIERKLCMSDKINRIVQSNFNTRITKRINLKGVQRISVQFTINQEGNIVNVKARAPHPALEKEAIRVIKLLPKMIPATQEGNPVAVNYGFPIKFQSEYNQKHLNKQESNSRLIFQN